MADQPRPAARWSASGNGRPVRKTAAIGSSSGRQGAEVVGEQGGLLGGPGRRREALRQLAPAAHGGDGIPCRAMADRSWFPESITGPTVVLRRHVPENLAAFRRWYADREIARLARYQETPMRPEEIERFFTAAGRRRRGARDGRPHARRRTGSSARARSASSTRDNGSALYHITIGESDAWGQGYGTEATQLMLDHAFGTLGLHRIALFVFEFNERADPRLPALRLRRRGPRARVDLARRPLVGRAGDERAGVRLAKRARETAAAEDGGSPAIRRRATSEPVRRCTDVRVRRRPTGCAGPSGGWR